MIVWLRRLIVAGVFGAFVSCAPQTPPGQAFQAPDKMTRRLVRERMSTVLVAESLHSGSWLHGKSATVAAPKDADGGSAAPIAEDGYFLTADHVLAEADGKSIYVAYANGGNIVARRARIVWRSESGDLALLHAPIMTPYYYQWSNPERRIFKGLPVIHGGMSTGPQLSFGLLRTSLAPERFFTGHRAFKMDMPLEPGDSGGPIVDAHGRLIGINTAVEFLVPMGGAIFMDSEGMRPNTRKIREIIDLDRHSRKSP